MKNLLKAALILALFTPAAVAKDVGGVKFDSSHKIGDKKVQFIGAGARSKWFIKVYALGAYSASQACDKNKIITAEEPKSLVLVMLRDVEAAQMASAINESLTKEIPDTAPTAIRNKRKEFIGLFKDKMTKGTKVVFDYLPEKGTTVTQNGKVLGTIAGSDFMQAFYKMYFEADGCCPELTKELLDCAKNKK